MLQSSQPGQDLQGILPSLNDELILLKRSASDPKPTWASKLSMFVVAQRRPLQTQVCACFLVLLQCTASRFGTEGVSTFIHT